MITIEDLIKQERDKLFKTHLVSIKDRRDDFLRLKKKKNRKKIINKIILKKK